MTNGDALDFRYSNIEIINQYAGVQRKESASGQVQYQTKIHVNGDFIVGTYADEISAAIAYNKAADTLAAHGISKAYARNYIVSMTNEQYHTAYTSISISKSLQRLHHSRKCIVGFHHIDLRAQLRRIRHALRVPSHMLTHLMYPGEFPFVFHHQRRMAQHHRFPFFHTRLFQMFSGFRK